MREYRTHLSLSILAAALMLHSHPCGAQSGSGCPVQIRHVKWQAASPGFSPSRHRGLAVYLQYMNVTDEDIREVVFDTTTSYREHGAVGQSMLENADKTPIAAMAPPRKWKKAEIDVGLSEPGRTRLRIADVTFSSGRHWVNSTSDLCVWTTRP
jgi:hypothetical protein